VNVLLDTQAFLWWTSSSARLSDRALDVIGDPATTVHVSVASAWEIAIKTSAGRLELEAPPAEYVADRLRLHGFQPVPIDLVHALRAGTLPRHHGDPFDRMIVAQGQLEDMPIVTADPLIGLYDVETIW
jgi:PIN domain nuclease of toxin-antitoxin system